MGILAVLGFTFRRLGVIEALKSSQTAAAILDGHLTIAL